MSVAINLNDELAGLLSEKAEEQRQSLEEFAVALLRNAVEQTTDEADWPARNRRRLQLIRNSVHHGLSVAEQDELDGLQQDFDRRFESFDRGLQDTMVQMKTMADEAQ